MIRSTNTSQVSTIAFFAPQLLISPAFSVDGLHSSDVEKYVALRPASTIATLLKTAYEYTDCYTSAPSDSFPGVAAFVTGASPKTTGSCYGSPDALMTDVSAQVFGMTTPTTALSGLHSETLASTVLGLQAPKV